jgi:hypothetical protein
MGPLRKLTINTENDISHAVTPIQDYVSINNYRGFIMCDSDDKIITDPNTKYIHQKFNGSDVFISAQSFQQNNQEIGNQIRKYVAGLVGKLNQITCVGGESYLYGLTCLIPNIYAYTNSQIIYNDIKYNSKFSKGNCKYNLCDYNKINQIEPSSVCLINLSSLNKNLMGVINKAGFEQIIIISCHHEDFWKKIKFLPNYKIKSRKQFVAYSLGYFLTVSILFKQ